MTPLERLEEAFSIWEGTPYMAGACLPGRRGGVDCVRFVDAVFQHVDDVELPPLPEEAQDGAWHDPRVVIRTAKLMRVRFGAERCREKVYPPGTALAISLDGNPFHAAVVGLDGIGVWHAAPNGVVKTSVQGLSVNKFRIRRAYSVRSLSQARPVLVAGCTTSA